VARLLLLLVLLLLMLLLLLLLLLLRRLGTWRLTRGLLTRELTGELLLLRKHAGCSAKVQDLLPQGGDLLPHRHLIVHQGLHDVKEAPVIGGLEGPCLFPGC
jgi:hypothetical protein